MTVPAPLAVRPDAAQLAAARRIADRAAARRWRGADPYDGLWWRWPSAVRGGRRRRQVLVQSHARSPVDLRRWRREPPPLIPKTIGAFLAVEAGFDRMGEGAGTAARARALRAELDLGAAAWGYPFDVQTRWSFYAAGTPNVVVTTFVARGLAAAHARWGDPGDAAAVARAAEWVLQRLYDESRGFFAYHPSSTTLIHNANLLGAELVAMAAPEADGTADPVRSAIRRTLEAQRPDGSWPYGDNRALGFVDGLHTAYVLTSLARLRDLDPDVLPALERGLDYYSRRLVLPDGTALLKPSASIEDAHSAGSALTALAALRDAGLSTRDLGESVAKRISAAVDAHGRVFFRHTARRANHMDYVRWCGAHVALGLLDHLTAP